jgi:hypothetical protein
MFSPITIVLTRDANSNNDDVLKIRPDEDNEGVYTVTYEDKNSKHKYEFTADWEHVEKYVSEVLTMLHYDEEPFFNVQFQFPSYPIIVVKPSQLKNDEFMDTIWNVFESISEDWPQRLVAPKVWDGKVTVDARLNRGNAIRTWSYDDMPELMR